MRPSNLGRSGAPEQNSDDSSVTARSSSGRRRVSYEVEVYKQTGQPEGEPAETVSKALLNGEIEVGSLCANDIIALMRWLDVYVKNYPKDTEALDLQSENEKIIVQKIEEIKSKAKDKSEDEIRAMSLEAENVLKLANFIADRHALSDKYKRLILQNPEAMKGVNKENTLEIIRFVRESAETV
jgi:hypothetical protein